MDDRCSHTTDGHTPCPGQAVYRMYVAGESLGYVCVLHYAYYADNATRDHQSFGAMSIEKWKLEVLPTLARDAQRAGETAGATPRWNTLQ